MDPNIKSHNHFYAFLTIYLSSSSPFLTVEEIPASIRFLRGAGGCGCARSTARFPCAVYCCCVSRCADCFVLLWQKYLTRNERKGWIWFKVSRSIQSISEVSQSAVAAVVVVGGCLHGDRPGTRENRLARGGVRGLTLLIRF